MTTSLRILLVDDHELLRRGLRVLLERQTGCVVVGEARNASEALEHMRVNGADLVVMICTCPARTAYPPRLASRAVGRKRRCWSCPGNPP